VARWSGLGGCGFRLELGVDTGCRGWEMIGVVGGGGTWGNGRLDGCVGMSGDVGGGKFFVGVCAFV